MVLLDENRFIDFRPRQAVEGYHRSIDFEVSSEQLGELLQLSRTVHYETIDDSAKAESDFTYVSGSLTFAPSQSSLLAIRPIKLINNNKNEDSESEDILFGHYSETLTIRFTSYDSFGNWMWREFLLGINDTLYANETNSIENFPKVENLSLAGCTNPYASVDGTGNLRNNVITGHDGKNTLSGLGGNDKLRGKGGNDSLIGGDGNDTLAGSFYIPGSGFNGEEIDELTGGAGSDIFILGKPNQILYNDERNIRDPLILSNEQLRRIMPTAGQARLNQYRQPLNAAMQEFSINNPWRQQAFIAQVAHESTRFSRVEENLNYTSAARIQQVWPRRFPTLQSAQPYVRNPEGLANYVYANRNGNGSVASGDGYRYRGRSLIHLTGRSNYEAASTALGKDLVNNPDLVLQPEDSARAAAWFWQSKGLNAIADRLETAGAAEEENLLKQITRVINGGLNGLDDRRSLYNLAKRVIGPFNDKDYAVVVDFNTQEDKIQLSGPQTSYKLYEQITPQKETNQPIPIGIAVARGNELIAVIKGGNPDLALTGNYFRFTN